MLKGGGEVPGGILDGWEQEGTDLKGGDEVTETTWRRRWVRSRRAGGGWVLRPRRDILDGAK